MNCASVASTPRLSATKNNSACRSSTHPTPHRMGMPTSGIEPDSVLIALALSWRSRRDRRSGRRLWSSGGGRGETRRRHRRRRDHLRPGHGRRGGLGTGQRPLDPKRRRHRIGRRTEPRSGRRKGHRGAGLQAGLTDLRRRHRRPATGGVKSSGGITHPWAGSREGGPSRGTQPSATSVSRRHGRKGASDIRSRTLFDDSLHHPVRWSRRCRDTACLRRLAGRSGRKPGLVPRRRSVRRPRVSSPRSQRLFIAVDAHAGLTGRRHRWSGSGDGCGRGWLIRDHSGCVAASPIGRLSEAPTVRQLGGSTEPSRNTWSRPILHRAQRDRRTGSNLGRT